MAARRKKIEDTIILPPIASNLTQTRQNAGKTFGNFGSYVLLPSLDPVQNMNATYDVKRFCKLLCEWYMTWRIWQREVLLCSLSERCSVNLLTLLSTILEPVFHRDFLSRLHGKYPDIKTKIVHSRKRRIDNKGDRTVGENDRKEGETSETKPSQEKVVQEIDLANDESGVTANSLGQEIEILAGEVETTTTKSSTVGENVGESQNKTTNVNHVSSLTNLIKESLSKADDDNENKNSTTKTQNTKDKKQPADQVPFQNESDMEKCRLCHVHTANIYSQDTASRFFSASHFKRLSDMRANPSRNARSGLGPCVGELDQKCYKHRRWWSADLKDKWLIPAQGLNLWRYFTKQLNEVNEKMESWGDHERVNLISQVLKSSDPEQINFFAQCLIQRLKDHADVSILPDQTLLKIFSKLDARTLCQISQVSRRWRYLAEDDALWKNKCIELGLTNNVKNLVALIEKSANNHTVDWKQAYQEVFKLFQERKERKSLQTEEFEVSAPLLALESASTSDESESVGTPENDRMSEHGRTSTATVALTADIHVELLDLTPASGDVESDKCSENGDANDDDLTGGNLGMLNDSISELTRKRREENSDEVAYDIRPNKIQPLNEMEEVDQQLVTVGVEDVKSVKRVRKLQGHMDGVYAVQFDPKRCLTGSADRLLRMWDVRSGRPIRTMTGHLGGVRCAQFDNDKIISGSWDTSIMIWDIIKFTCIGVLHGHQGCVSCLRFNSTHLVSGSHDMTARVWDVDTLECLHVLEGHTGEVTCLFLGGIFLLTGSTDKTVRLWQVVTGECLKTLEGHESSVLSVQACRSLVISGSEEGKIMFWDLEQASPVAIIQAHDGPCNCLFVWGSHFLSGGGDRLVKEWDIGTMTCLRTLQGHKGPVHCVKMSWSKIISSSEDGTVRIWDLEAPIHKLGRQFDEFENTLLPFDTLEQNDDD